MKASTVGYLALGYVLGARAGRERYEAIVRIARRVIGSQTLQSSVGVAQGQFDHFVHQARRGGNQSG